MDLEAGAPRSTRPAPARASETPDPAGTLDAQLTPAPGTQGAPAPPGAPGLPGARGLPGAKGSPPAQGTLPPQGTPGTPPAPGTLPPQGTPPARGTQGAPGTPGVLESLVEAHVAMDDHGIVVGWNHEAELLLGWAREEALGREAAELFIPAELRDRHRAGLERVRATGRSKMAGKRLELVAVDRSGRRFPVELTIRLDPASGPGGAPPPTPVFHGLLRDITERHHAHRELHDRETFLRSLVDGLDVGVIACDETGRQVIANKALRLAQTHLDGPTPLLGPVEPDVLADRLRLYRPDSNHLLDAEELPLLRALRGEKVMGEEVLMRPPNRPPLRFRINGRRVLGPDGELRGAVVELHDVTADHDAALMRAGAAAFAMETGTDIDDDSLQRGLSVLGGELGWARVGYWVVDHANHLELVSSWHPSRADQPWHPDLARQALAGSAGWAQVEGSRSRRVTFPVTSGGRTIGVLEFADGGYGEPGAELVSLLLSVSAQIARHTERRRAEELAETLAEQRATFERVLRQVDDHVWSIELLEDGSVRSNYASSNVYNVFGEYLPEGVDPGAHILDRVHPDDVPRFLEYLRRGQEGQVADVEVRIVGFDDVVRWIWVRGVPRREGDRRFVDGISTDVTERRELQVERERLLQQAQQQTERQLTQLHELDRMKDEFLATMSHELRNPVSVIQGYAALALENQDVPPSVRSMVDAIRRRTDQLHQLVEELFAHARLEAGLTELQREPVDLDHLVGRAEPRLPPRR